MKNLYLLLLVLAGATQFSKAQTAGQYYFKATTGVALEDMSADAIPLIGSHADGIFSNGVPFFSFSFAGGSYNTFSVSEDGLVVLGDAVYTPYPYDDYFAQSPAVYGQKPAYPILLAWGEDLYTANGGVSYKIIGTAPARKLVIQFRENSAEDNSEMYNKTFQVWLFEGSNRVQYVYGATTSDWYNNANIGIAGSATDYLSVNSATNTVSSTEVASNSGNYPDKAPLPVNGTAYIFSPTAIANDPVPPPPSPITATVSISPEYPVPGQQQYTIYLGYGAQSVSLSTSVSGGNPPATGYTYSWSPATGLSSPTAASPTASPTVTTTYTVTISDGNGNTITKSATVYVNDPRVGKNFVTCQKGKEILLSYKALKPALDGGAQLGHCSVAGMTSRPSTAGAIEFSPGETPSSRFAVYPSPSNGAFTIQFPESVQSTTIIVYDAGGRVVAKQVAGGNQSMVQMDLTNKAPGIYLIKMICNGKVRTGKIIIQ